MKILLLLVVLVALSSAEQSALQQVYSRGNREFSAKVYQEVAKSQPGNFLVCPFSVETVLALTGIGAKDDTASEIYRSVSLPQDPKQVQGIYREIIPSFRGNSNYNLSTANKVYIQKGFQVLDEFKQTAVDVFGSEVEDADFVGDTRGSVQKINKWVADKTKDKIQDIVNEQVITPDSRLVLVNALYFSGFWQTPFNKYATKRGPFYLNEKDSTEVDTMFVTDTYRYYECSRLNAKFLEMDYEGGDISMTIVLPNERNGLAALEARLPEVFEDRNFTYERVNVLLPKFTIESTIQFNPILQNLGMRKAFDSQQADFSGIDGKKDLYISTVIQKTFINVTEDGTEAAAATVVQFIPLSGHFAPISQPKNFHADHPFVFFLKKNDVPFFVGRYQRPY